MNQITREELKKFFQKKYPNKIILLNPYFNELRPKDGWKIRIIILKWDDIWLYIYLIIDEEGSIKNIEKGNYKEFINELLGQRIDLKTFNEEIICGNYTECNGIVKNGKFILSKK